VHALHDELPLALEYEFIGHGRQSNVLVAPVYGLKKPGGHGEHVVTPVVPAGHNTEGFSMLIDVTSLFRV
jgi:hypothetical protein